MKLTTVPTVLITGPIGVGKTSVAYAVSERLRAASVPHALVDVDAIVVCYPAPADDPFNIRLSMANLAALWRNFTAAGAAYLILARVVEGHDELDAYRKAIPGADLTVVRLRAPVDTLDERILRRAAGTDTTWEKARTRQLSREMDATKVEDILIETRDRSIDEIAEEILGRLGWTAAL